MKQLTQVTLNGRSFDLCTQIRHNPKIEASFLALALKTFALDFAPWVQAGYWDDRYIPYALIAEQRVVANVSVNRLSFNHHGVNKTAIQIGTVMTDVAYRNLGLADYLMTQVLAEYAPQADCVYLYANDSVRDFYPRYGFKIAQEYQWGRDCSPHTENVPHGQLQQLDMANSAHIALLREHYATGNPFSAVNGDKGFGLLMFCCHNFLRAAVYYSRAHNLIAIRDCHEGVATYYEFLGTTDLTLDAAITLFYPQQAKTCVLGFTPKESTGFHCTPFLEEDTTLFVLSGKEALFEEPLLLPLLTHG